MTAFKDLENTFDLTEEEYNELIVQVQSEISVSQTFMLPKWEIWRKRLKLYNNQKKDVSAIGDPLIFPQFQTLLAALHNDRLKTKFTPREQGDDGVAENLNPLYEYDAVIMNKSQIDYNWTWNSMFFGRALLYMFEFDTKTNTPCPEVVNMMTFYRDPNAKSVNGDQKGRGAMRFGGRPILLTDKQMVDSDIYSNISEITSGDNVNSELAETNRRIKEAQGFSSTEANEVSGENNQKTVMEWLTFYKGKRVVVGVANGATLVVRLTELKDQDEWGVKERMIYPDSLSWDGTSVMDLLEDKQRARARILNASLFNVEANSNIMYAYDINKLDQQSDLNFAPNKHIGVDGDPTNVIQPISRGQITNETKYMVDTLSAQAEKATGVSEVRQGALSGSGKTATEIATVSEGADTRFALSSKVIGWSEKEFARYWYKMYKMYFPKLIGEKVMRLNGLNGAIGWRKLGRDNIIAKVDPDIGVESELVTEAQRLKKLQNYTNSFQIMSTSPQVNKELLVKIGAELNGYNEAQMLALFQPTADQIIQREENGKINDGKFVPVSPNDDDMVHLLELQKAVDGKAKDAHEKAHLKAIEVKAKNPNVKQEAGELEATQAAAKELSQGPNIGSQNFNAPSTLNTAKQV